MTEPRYQKVVSLNRKDNERVKKMIEGKKVKFVNIVRLGIDEMEKKVK